MTNLAEIRGFRIVSETGIASGVRRIEAVSGDGIIELLARRDSVVKAISSSLKVTSVSVHLCGLSASIGPPC